MRLIQNNTPIPFKDQEFTLVMTGEDIVHLHRLSYYKECGDQFPIKDNERIHGKLEAMFPNINLDSLGENLKGGKLP